MNIAPNTITEAQAAHVTRFGTFNSATLTATDVQAIRDLHRCGFRITTIARAFGTCHRAVSDVIHGRTWRWLADVPAPLPIMPADRAVVLRVKNAAKLTPAQRKALEEYRRQLEQHHDAEADAEGRAIALMSCWLGSRRGRKQSASTIDRMDNQENNR